MADLETTLSLAKRGRYSRAETYSALQALAEQHRQPGESEHQSFAKYISGEGRELFALCQSLPGRDIEPMWQAPITKGQPGAGDTHVPTTDWDGLVNGLMRSQKISRNKAITAALSSEEGRHLFRAQKRSEQIATGQFTQADMAALDGADKERQEHEDVHKRANQYKSEFEHMVDDVRRDKLHLTEAAAGDFVRSKPEGMAAWLKHKGLPGRNGLTMYQDPPRTSQWDSPHAGSQNTPPTGEPWRAGDIRPGPDEEPALKAWSALKKKMMFDTGFSEERTVEILKLMPEGKRAIARVIAAAEAGGSDEGARGAAP